MNTANERYASRWDELTCPAHVKFALFALDDTEGAKRYLQSLSISSLVGRVR